MSSTALRSQLNKRPTSRSGSASPSSSVVTVKRVASPTSRDGSHPSNQGLGPHDTPLIAAKPAASEARPKRRRSQSRPGSVVAAREGAVNPDRWSKPAISSKSSAASHQRRNSFAKRLSGSFQSLGAYNTPQTPTATTNVLRKLNLTPNYMNPVPMSPGMALGSPSMEMPSLPGRITPAVILPSIAHAVDAAPTPHHLDQTASMTSELLPSATYMPGDGDYFGEAWAGTPPAGSKKLRESPSISPYLGSPPNHQVKAGANNSFALSPNPIESSPARDRQRAHASKMNPRLGPPRNGEIPNQENGAAEGEHSETSVPLQERDRTLQERRSRHRKAPSQKIMLAKALEKANHAVVLDNAQNFEGAMEAYEDACSLLHHVMVRTSGDEDKKKLDAIKNTYRARIFELESNELAVVQNVNNKALPDVPESVLGNGIEPFSPSSEEDDAERGAMGGSEPSQPDEERAPTLRPLISRTLTREQLPPRQQSLMPRDHSSDGIRLDQSPMPRDMEFRPVAENAMLAVPMEMSYMPPPLSPRMTDSPVELEPKEVSNKKPAPDAFHPGHTRQETAESTSWLDTIDESGGSSSSSVHSKASFEGLRRKHIRTGSGDTEAEFDSALDAAIEAAYNEGYEPASDTEEVFQHDALGIESDPVERVSEARRNVDLARQRVREAEREAAIASAKEREKMRWIEEASHLSSRNLKRQSVELEYDDDEAEEEERMLEEMTRGYVMEDVEYDGGTKSALPRKSDSSGFSGRTYGSSVGSMPTTAGTGTPLSTVAETALSHQKSNVIQKKTGTSQPPSMALPPPPGSQPSVNLQPLQIPKLSAANVPSLSVLASPGVRERRLSGQKVKQLKIDTNAKLPTGMAAPKTQPLSKLALPLLNQISEPPRSASILRDGQSDAGSLILKSALPLSGRLASSPFQGPSSAEPLSGVSETTAKNAQQKDGQAVPLSGSPVRHVAKTSTHNVLRKNFSSSSLKSLRQPLVTPPTTEESPSTPIHRVFSSSMAVPRNMSLPVVPDLPTPSLANFAKAGVSAGTLSFFDSDIHSPHTPGSPNPASANAPVPLEPCPESFLLRPFWLLRALYQTLAHPRGGYLSTRLFVPRDVWRVKNVKLKNVEEKVACCDLLTAALLKLSKVDTLDADAVMEEMQAFELVLDQVQVQLAKKLGTEVGIQGSVAMFRNSQNPDENGMSNELLSAKSQNSGVGKSYLSSWRKLRSKNSMGPGLPSSVHGGQGKETSRETLTMRSLPMTSMMNPRFTKRDPTKVLGIGPHAHYMAALARLCDAVQVVDQVARQVEDPGLRLSSKTHVGLELSTRHAAEFFAFFVCRFALTDIGMMLDKFVKRGSEWVLG